MAKQGEAEARRFMNGVGVLSVCVLLSLVNE